MSDDDDRCLANQSWIQRAYVSRVADLVEKYKSATTEEERAELRHMERRIQLEILGSLEWPCVNDVVGQDEPSVGLAPQATTTAPPDKPSNPITPSGSEEPLDNLRVIVED